MDFDLSEEQRLLKESVDGLLRSSYDFDARKKYMAEKGGWSKAVWGKLAEVWYKVSPKDTPKNLLASLAG